MNGARRSVWVGRGLSGLVILFLGFDIGIKLVQLPVVGETLGELGYPSELGLTIGIVELVCLVLYAMPRTAVLGAILLTAVFGGAIASHIRVASPLFTHISFGVYLGLLVWGGLYLRSARLRDLIPLQR
jgi:DoxX-like family